MWSVEYSEKYLKLLPPDLILRLGPNARSLIFG